VQKHALIEKARAHVAALLKATKPDWVKYHNFEHAKAVARASKTIGTACNLSAEALEVVMLAAWFHDAGYVEAIEGHEEKSVEIAAAFLRDQGYPPKRVAKVAGCIRATKMPQNPGNLMEQVLCDADISHLARKDFLEISELIRLEIEHRMGRKLSEAEWLTMNTLFVAGHQFHTDYARSKYAPQHAVNLAALKERLNRAKSRLTPFPRAEGGMKRGLPKRGPRMSSSER
jgi:predicted metal-dependent HD superfamily phosphohydrolase